MSILPCLCLEVKEISAKSVAFRDGHAHPIYVAFRDNTAWPGRRNALHFNTSSWRRNCNLLAGRFGGVAHVTPMCDVQTGIDEFIS